MIKNKKIFIIFIMFVSITVLNTETKAITYQNTDDQETAYVSKIESAGSSDSIYSVGSELFRLGKYQLARNAFRRDLSTSYNILGAATSARLMGDNQGAVKYYSMLIERNPDIAEAYFGRALAYRGLEEYNKAIADFKTSLEKEKRVFTYAGIGDLYILTGKNKDAREYLEEGNKLYPDSKLIKDLLIRAYSK